MEQPYPIDERGAGFAPSPNSAMQMAYDQGIQEAIHQENRMNQTNHQPIDYQAEMLGEMPPEEDEYADFVEEEVIKKPKKKYNDSKEKVSLLIAKNKKEQEEKEAALIRAEIAEREQKRLRDEIEFLSLSSKRDNIDRQENHLKELWRAAHEENDIDTIQEVQRDLQRLNAMRDQYESEITHVKDRYQTEREEEEREIDYHQELEQTQKAVLEEFSDARELASPLYNGFLEHHDFLNPFNPNYDGHLAERVQPIKNDLIQELKLNGQYDDIGTSDYFTELSRRIQKTLNPRYQRKESVMNDPRYREPNYGQIRQELEQQYVQPQYQQPMYQQPMHQPHQQMAYPPQGYGQPQGYNTYQQPGQSYQNYQPQQPAYVAPVNRSGYNQGYDPMTTPLDSMQQEAADLFGNVLNDLSREVYGRGMGRDEVHEHYRRGISNEYNGRR